MSTNAKAGALPPLDPSSARVEEQRPPTSRTMGERESKRAWYTWLLPSFGFDLRSLALMRIVVCAFYLCDLMSNWNLVEAFYSDAGLIPRAFVFDNFTHPVSVYLAVSTEVGARLLYSLHILAVVCVMLGYRTRWASLAAYVFVVSLQNRFPIYPGWGTEIRMLFLIGVFMPWAECASLDARRAGTAAPAKTLVVSAATFAWRVQVAVLYVTSGLLKGGAGWKDGTAVELALNSDSYSNWIGHWFLAQCQHIPGSLSFLNDTVPITEIFAPVLLLSPWPWLQMLGVLILWAMHTCFGLCLSIGFFGQICSSCMLCFIPGAVWDNWPLSGLFPAGRRLERGDGDNRSTRTVGQLHPWQSVFLTWVALSMVISAEEGLPESGNWVTPSARGPWLVLGVEQRWGMFVPPPFEGGWHIVKGRTARGEWVDLLHDRREVTESAPEFPSKLYANVHILLFFTNYMRVAAPEGIYLRRCALDYYRRAWERAHPAQADRIRECEVDYYHRAYEPGKGFGEATKTVLASKQSEN